MMTCSGMFFRCPQNDGISGLCVGHLGLSRSFLLKQALCPLWPPSFADHEKDEISFTRHHDLSCSSFYSCPRYLLLAHWHRFTVSFISRDGGTPEGLGSGDG